MKKILFFLLVFFSFTRIVFSENGVANCDLCGYCPPNPPPSTWEKCQKCIYPNASSDYTSGETLKISGSDEGAPPTPFPGHQYTMLGCIGTNLSSFRQEGAAAGVVQTLLNIVFSMVGGVAFLFLIYGSFIIITSQASPERLNYGKKIIAGAIVGAIFSISSVFLINLLASGVLKIPGFQ